MRARSVGKYSTRSSSQHTAGLAEPVLPSKACFLCLFCSGAAAMCIRTHMRNIPALVITGSTVGTAKEENKAHRHTAFQGWERGFV